MFTRIVVLIFVTTILNGCNQGSNKSSSLSEPIVRVGEGAEIELLTSYDSTTRYDDYGLVVGDTAYHLFSRVYKRKDTSFYLLGHEDPLGYTNILKLNTGNSIIRNLSYTNERKSGIWVARSINGELFEKIYYVNDRFVLGSSYKNGKLKRVHGSAIVSFGSKTPIRGNEAAIAKWVTAIPDSCRLLINLGLKDSLGRELYQESYNITAREYWAALNVDDPGEYILSTEWALILNDSILLDGILDFPITKKP